MRLARPLLLITVAVGACLLAAGPSLGQSQGDPVDVVQIKGVIDTVQADYLIDRLSDDPERQAVVIELDTPGGLDADLGALAAAIEGAGVPVVCWIAPRGAEAASTATFIAAGCDLTFISEDSTLGPALPADLALGVDGFRPDASARLADIAASAGRDDYEVEGILERRLPATDAISRGFADGVASTLDALLAEIDGLEVRGVTLETFDPSTGSLSAPVRFQGMGVLDRILHTVTAPHLAYLLLLAGLFGLIFEVYNPGIGLAGGVGAAALGLSLYGLNALPVNWLGVLVVVVGVLALLTDLQTGGLGLFTIGGAAGVVGGGAIMFPAPAPELQLSVWVLVTGALFTAIFFISVMTAALRVRLRRPVTEDDRVVGMVAVARTDIAPEGTVLSKGQLWRARTMETGIAEGAKVKVMATEGSVLLVEPFHEDSEE